MQFDFKNKEFLTIIVNYILIFIMNKNVLFQIIMIFIPAKK